MSRRNLPYEIISDILGFFLYTEYHRICFLISKNITKLVNKNDLITEKRIFDDRISMLLKQFINLYHQLYLATTQLNTIIINTICKDSINNWKNQAKNDPEFSAFAKTYQKTGKTDHQNL